MRRVVIILAVGALLAPAAVAARAPEAGPAPKLGPVPDGSDFDSDGFDDLAIGAPFDDVAGKAGAGVVNVLYGSPSGLRAADEPGGPVTIQSQVWHQDRPDVADIAEAGDRFGSSIP